MDGQARRFLEIKKEDGENAEQKCRGEYTRKNKMNRFSEILKYDHIVKLTRSREPSEWLESRSTLTAGPVR